MWLRLAAAFGLEPLHNRDISKQVLATREYVLQQLTERREELVESFRPFRPKVEAELESVLRSWKHDTEWFEQVALFEGVEPKSQHVAFRYRPGSFGRSTDVE